MLLALIARPAPAPRHASIRAALPHAGAPMDRRTALGAFAAAMVPFAAQSEEVIEEEDYTPQAGLAKLTATVEQVAQLVERSDLDQLAALIRSPVMVSFLGYEPVSESTKEVLALDPKKALQNQLKLIQAFPASSRRSAVDGLSSILEQVRTIDRLCIEKRGQQNADVEPLRKCASEVRLQAAEITRLYYAAGCMVCSEPVQSVIASDATWSNPNLAVLDKFQPRVNRRPERTPEEEKLALRLGFRPD